MGADSRFAFVQSKGDNGLEQLLQQWKKPLPSSDTMELLTSLLNLDPSKRPSAIVALESSWFS